jgi:hypothetical protein
MTLLSQATHVGCGNEFDDTHLSQATHVGCGLARR